METKNRILLAEDELRVAAPIMERLRSEGHTVTWVKATRELREAMAEFQPDILLLDVTLDTDGLEYFQAIRFAPEHPPGGVVMLTPPGNMVVKERAQQLGAAAVMMKPVDEQHLIETLEDLLTFVN